MNRHRLLKQTEKTITNLIELSKKCKSKRDRQKFSNLGITFVIWLATNYTIDLTEDILVNTQLLDIKDKPRDSFYTIVNLLKTTKLKVKNKYK